MSTAVEFDFATKASRTIPAEEAAGSCQRGHSCWIDLDTTDRAAAETVLKKLGVSAVAIDRVFGPEEVGRYDSYDDCLHVAATAVSVRGDELVLTHLDIIIARQFV